LNAKNDKSEITTEECNHCKIRKRTKSKEMKLTGKAKQDFNTWLVRGEDYQDYEEILQSFAFESLPDSMKWGVYQDFFILLV